MAILIIFPVILHTVINVIMLSTGGQDSILFKSLHTGMFDVARLQPVKSI